jgi:hypothetical protein
MYINFIFASTISTLIKLIPVVSIVIHSNSMIIINIFHESKWPNGDYKTDGGGYSKQ